MIFNLLLLLLFSPPSGASIFGKDDRVDTIDSSSRLQTLGRSVPALIQKKNIQRLENGTYSIIGTSLKEIGFCADENFAEEKQIANCTGSFIGGNRILTAAHCITGERFSCDTYSVVFDYQRPQIPMSADYSLTESQIYSCKKVLYSQFNPLIASEDLAVIELDRPVEGREAIQLEIRPDLKAGDPLVMIGYPLGISQKIVDDGRVLEVDPKNFSFKHSLDSFSVNSGSPIFTDGGNQIGVLVRGTGPNYVKRINQACFEWHNDNGQGFSDANDLTSLKKLKYLKFIK